MQKEKFPHVLRQNIRKPFHENWQSYLGNSSRDIFCKELQINSTVGRKEGGEGQMICKKMSNEKIIWQASPIFNPVIPISPIFFVPH